MPDRETWDFINSFAPWFSALGTLCAVLVSLYLASRTSRHRVRVSCSIVRTIPTGQRLGDGAEFLQIRVVNRGSLEVVVSGIMWKQRGFRRQSYVVFPPDDPYSTKVPAKLQYGDQALFFFLTKILPDKDIFALRERVAQNVRCCRTIFTEASTIECWRVRVDRRRIPITTRWPHSEMAG